MRKLILLAAIAVSGCGEGSDHTQTVEQRALERLSVALDQPQNLRVHGARVVRQDTGKGEVICGKVSYSRGGVPSEGAEKFVIFPGIVAVEGQPTKTFTFDHLYAKEGRCQD